MSLNPTHADSGYPTMNDKKTLARPPVVSLAQWQVSHEQLLAKEKAATRARDALAAERRRMPITRVEKVYVFDGPNGPLSLADLFNTRRQLILYHFMFAPGVHGWPTAGCPGFSMFVDQIGHLAHFAARDTHAGWSVRAECSVTKDGTTPIL